MKNLFLKFNISINKNRTKKASRCLQLIYEHELIVNSQKKVVLFQALIKLDQWKKNSDKFLSLKIWLLIMHVFFSRERWAFVALKET